VNQRKTQADAITSDACSLREKEVGAHAPQAISTKQTMGVIESFYLQVVHDVREFALCLWIPSTTETYCNVERLNLVNLQSKGENVRNAQKQSFF